jgi:hypothetical protein
MGLLECHGEPKKTFPVPLNCFSDFKVEAMQWFIVTGSTTSTMKVM